MPRTSFAAAHLVRCRALKSDARGGQAFLGPDEAEEFVTWLWELLSTVENKTLDLSGEEVAVPCMLDIVHERVSRASPVSKATLQG